MIMEGKQMSNRDISVEIIGSLSAINAQDWDACADPDPTSDRPLDPFTTYRFLRALEDSGSVGDGTGWQPLYMVARDQKQIIGTAPMYLKSH
jgi:predicted N-acyltransferase